MPNYIQRPYFWRVFYGSKARDMIPWQVALSIGCGGTILDSKTILSAAHCVQQNQTLSIRAGSRNKNFGGQVRVLKCTTSQRYQTLVHILVVTTNK